MLGVAVVVIPTILVRVMEVLLLSEELEEMVVTVTIINPEMVLLLEALVVQQIGLLE
jgi:hypothetical protein